MWTYYQCLVTQYFYGDELEKARELLEHLTEEKRPKGVPFYDIFIHLNLTGIYYCQGDLRQAMEHLARLFTKEIFNKLSKEVQLQLGMIEIILHFENDDIGFLAYKITEVRRSFKQLLKQDAFEKERSFLKIMRKCIAKNRPFQDKVILKNIEVFVQSVPKFELGSNEAINYQLWLQSKSSGVPYYKLVLKQV